MRRALPVLLLLAAGCGRTSLFDARPAGSRDASPAVVFADGGVVKPRPDAAVIAADGGGKLPPDAGPFVPDAGPPPGPALGTPCRTSRDCGRGGECFTEEDTGFPGGYCTRPCAPGSMDCGAGACVAFDDRNEAWCFAPCTSDDVECRAPGYVCETVWFGQRLPANACVPGRRQVPIGSPCATLGDCDPSAYCLGAEDGFPGGYCTLPCGSPTQGCPKGSFCAVDFGICLVRCAGERCARRGYACSARVAGTTLPERTCVAFREGAHVGDACASFADCALGAFCIPEEDENGDPTGFTNGYCSAPCGTPMTRCPAGSTCLDADQNPLCVATCRSDSECRAMEGYRCQSTTPNASACLP